MDDTRLTDAELEELDDFLLSGDIEDTSMDVATLEGFLVAIVIGPAQVPMTAWLPWVWDMYDGEREPGFADAAQAARVLGLLQRFHDTVAGQFATDPDGFDPVFWHGLQWGAAEWCEGFLTGTQFRQEQWQQLAHERPDWFEPLFALASGEPVPPGLPPDEAEALAHELMEAVGPLVVRLHAHWRGGP